MLLTGIIQHHAGLILIFIAFLSLLYQRIINGKKIYLPGHFFLIYGLGEIFLVLSSYYLLNEALSVSMLEGILGIISLYLYFKGN
jgi:ascorbate-specific PTS system EIIC-type component UlaA